MSFSKSSNRLAAVALFLFGTGVCLYYGRLGVNPLDQSILFDGGWRIYSGQLPFRDFATPLGIVPSVMQALFFATGGVSWFTYCLHAAVINGLFGLVTFATAQRLGAGFMTSWCTGIASAIVLYPPMGAPFSEQHSFFFSACCLWATLSAVQSRSLNRGALFAAPACAVLALFSKLVPAAFLTFPCVALLMMWAMMAPRTRLPWVAAGLALPAAAFGLYLAATEATVRDAVYFGLALPLSVGASRTVEYQTTGILWLRMDHIWSEWDDLLIVARALVAGLWLATAAIETARRAFGDLAGSRRSLALLFLSMWLTLATGAFTYVTNNAAANGLALLPLIFLTAWLGFREALQPFAVRWNYLRVARRTLAVLVFALSAFEIWNFNDVVNEGRLLTRFDHDAGAWSLPGPMRFARFQQGYSPYDARDIIPYIQSRPENFLLYGDSLFLYGVTGHPSVFPALWFHWGLTMPTAESEEFARFDARVAERMAAYNVRYIIEERGGTPMGGPLEKFGSLTRLVAGCSVGQVGGWTIREICN